MRYEFDHHVFDTDRRELTVDGRAVPLRPKVFSLLHYLIDHRDRVVPKQELFDELWPGLFVGDATLNTCIKSARQAVGDSGQAQSVIRTLHGHGYRFVADVEELDDAPASEDAVARPTEPADPPVPDLDPTQRAVLPEPVTAGPSPSAFASGKEHKQVTILHCAMCEAPELSAEIGPEAMDDVMENFIATANRLVRHYGGTCTQWLGDGFVALFGAPIAYEDHARLAVCAALDLQEQMKETQSGQPRPASIGIGLHTGPVVVGTLGGGGGQIFTAAGTATETARRLQDTAPPGTVLASESTHAIVFSEVSAAPFVRDSSSDSDLGTIYRIDGLVARRSGVPSRGRPRVSRFVGRARELAILRDRVAQLGDGGGEVISITGEPGIGKSRLIDELAGTPEAEGLPFLRVNCLSFGTTSPYLPIRRLLRQICGTTDVESPESAVAKLEARIGAAGIDTPFASPLLAEILTARTDPGSLRGLSPDVRRAQTFSSLHQLVAANAAARPGVIVIEDLQWIDATSEAWLSELVMRLAGLPLLLIVSYRPGYPAPWLQQSAATQISLPRLNAEDSEALLRSAPPSSEFPETALQRVISKAQGNPFFLEEIAWTLADRGLDVPTLPDTIQAVIAARIDQLAPDDKRLLQHAAVVGPVVPISLLRCIDGIGGEERERSLVNLQQSEFFFERQSSGERVVAFKHTLTQEVAYQGLLRRTRAAIHRRIADALLSEFADIVENRPELVAHHLENGGDPQRAIDHWHLAGKRAAERSADVEAIVHFRTALSLMESLPDRAGRSADELAILLDLGVSLQNVEGPGAAAVGEVYERAHAIGPLVASSRQDFQVLWGLWTNRQTLGEFNAAKDQAGKLDRIARESDDSELFLQAKHARWTTARFVGDLETAIEESDAALDMPRTASPTYAFGGHDPIVCARGVRSIVFWLQGFADRSAREIAGALSLAESLDHPASIAHGLVNAVELQLMLRDAEALATSAERLDALSAKYGFTMPRAVGDFAEAWCRGQRGEIAAGVAGMERALEAMSSVGRVYQEAYHAALLAEMDAGAGRHSEGADRLENVLRGIESHGAGHWAEAEVYRLLGEVILASPGGDRGEAEKHFEQAIGIAAGQGASLLELRATNSLCRLLGGSRRAAEAVARLAPVYSQFSEGFATADLRETRALLAELGHA